MSIAGEWLVMKILLILLLLTGVCMAEDYQVSDVEKKIVFTHELVGCYVIRKSNSLEFYDKEGEKVATITQNMVSGMTLDGLLHEEMKYKDGKLYIGAGEDYSIWIKGVTED